METKKITLKDRATGNTLEVTKQAYNMRKHKYDQTHTVVQPQAPKPSVDDTDKPEEVEAENTTALEKLSDEKPKERQKPGPKPKTQAE